jgi:CRISPR-associated endonuclease Csn1
MVDSSDTTANFIPNFVSNLIYSLPKVIAERFCNGTVVQNEFGIGSHQSKNQRAITGEMIKETCLPLKIDRLGNIIENI